MTGKGSALSRYLNVVVGSGSLLFMIYYEFCMMLGPIPGALGLFMRKLFWPRLFRRCGTGAVFATNVVVRHPQRICIGKRVVISEGCILDARNNSEEEVINLGNDVILSNHVMISCKNGAVKIGDHTGISAQTVIHSTQGNPVNIGSDVIIGPHCYVVGGGNYNTDNLNIPIWKQGIKFDGGVVLENNVWLGAGVTVLGGVRMATGSIAAAGAVINSEMPTNSICGGLPAKILKYRA